MKKSYSATSSIPFTLTFVNRTIGEIALSLTDVETSALDRRRYVYDIVLEDPNGYKTKVREQGGKQATEKVVRQLKTQESRKRTSSTNNEYDDRPATRNNRSTSNRKTLPKNNMFRRF